MYLGLRTRMAYLEFLTFSQSSPDIRSTRGVTFLLLITEVCYKGLLG